VSAPERTPEELRRSALALLGGEHDPLPADVLAHAELAVAWAVDRWESSHGAVVGHRVTMLLDARRLGQLRAHPSALDAICAALATAIAMRPNESLVELATRWVPDARAATMGYRDAPPPPVSLKEALVAYLDGAGNARLARAVALANIERAGVTELIVRDLPSEGRSSYSELARAVRALLGEARLRVRVES
jgi:hypothetical protein